MAALRLARGMMTFPLSADSSSAAAQGSCGGKALQLSNRSTMLSAVHRFFVFDVLSIFRHCIRYRKLAHGKSDSFVLRRDPTERSRKLGAFFGWECLYLQTRFRQPVTRFRSVGIVGNRTPTTRNSQTKLHGSAGSNLCSFRPDKPSSALQKD